MLNNNAGHGLNCSLRMAKEMLTEGKADQKRSQQGNKDKKWKNTMSCVSVTKEPLR